MHESRDKKNALDLLRSTGFNLFPQGFLSGWFDDSLLEPLGLGGFKVDVRETKEAYIIDAEMPGIDKDKIVIDINDHLLTISTQIDEQTEEKDEDGQYLRRERRYGSFRRSFPLDNIQSDKIKAEMKNGILTVHCPKKNQTLPNSKRISID